MSYQPGPWRLIEWTRNVRDHVEISFDVADKNGTPIVRVGKNEANARLIVEAPEMLELLIEIYRIDNDADYSSFSRNVLELLKRVQGD